MKWVNVWSMGVNESRNIIFSWLKVINNYNFIMCNLDVTDLLRIIYRSDILFFNWKWWWSFSCRYLGLKLLMRTFFTLIHIRRSRWGRRVVRIINETSPKFSITRILSPRWTWNLYGRGINMSQKCHQRLHHLFRITLLTADGE